MENNSGFDVEAVYFDDDVLFHETVMEIIAWEKEDELRSTESRLELPDIMTEDAFRLLMETACEE
ncbi:hypothetical protein LLE49_07930 [Alicyclobacillus tolerans]|uniref:hypothetical protein n=1 Tax=Alicyclobacillus tolerans TaxID=90970 RepID=UPI001F1EB1A9|nr:hypothetical protein [Alicyclobacillus tolerans]MCF8564674.1 hypothetical protein [Alicyclobacillus tolerans]